MSLLAIWSFALLLFIPCYAVPFLLLAFLRRWYLLIPGGAASMALVVWAFGDISKADTPGVMLALPMISLIAFGSLAGFLAAALVLAGRRFSWRWARPAIVLPAVFVALPLAALASNGMHRMREQARLAPPPAACLTSLHPVILGDLPLALPLAPGLTVHQGRGDQPRYDLGINADARSFCDVTDAAPVTITSLTMRLMRIDAIYQVHSSPFCATPKAYGWWHDLCRRDWKDLSSDYPSEITFYAVGQFDVGRRLGFSEGGLARLQARHVPFTDLPGGIRRYGDGHGGSDGLGFTFYARRDSPTYLATCESRRPKDELVCRVIDHLTPRIGINYVFRTPSSAFAERSAIVDKQARAMLDSLKR